MRMRLLGSAAIIGSLLATATEAHVGLSLTEAPKGALGPNEWGAPEYRARPITRGVSRCARARCEV